MYELKMEFNIVDEKDIILDKQIYSNDGVDTILGKYLDQNIVVKRISEEITMIDLKKETIILQMLNNNDNKYVIKYEGPIIKYDKIVGIVTEYIKYGTLDDYLRENANKIDLKFINRLLLKICKSIKYLHQQGVFHNDIKTTNIMFIDKNYENIKLIDFGASGTKDIFPYIGSYSAPEFNQAIYVKLYEEYVVDKEIKTLEDFFPPFYDKNDVFQLGFVIWDIFHFPQNYPYIGIQEQETYENWKLIFQNNEKKMKKQINESVPDIYKKIINGCWKHNMFERITIDEIIKLLSNNYFDRGV
jgi:serine/threonine protein kinase